MSTAGPYDRDPPWSEPQEKPPCCDACGTERYESDTETCGGCGFKWVEISAAVKCVKAVAKELGLDLSIIHEDRRRAAVEAALGEMTDPMNPMT